MGVSTIARNITERKHAEQALRKSEEDYRTLFREMLNGFALHEIICDAQGHPTNYRFIVVNPAFERMTGLKAEDIVGRTVTEVLPEIEPHWIETFGKVALTGNPTHFVNPSAGLSKTFQVSAFRPAPNQFACIFVDITERQQAAEALRESQQRLDLALRSAKLGIWDWDITNNRMTWDDQMFRLYGIAKTPGSCGVEIWEQGLHPDDKAQAWAACQASLLEEKEFNSEFRVKHPDGTIRNIQANGQVLRDKAGKPIRMLGVNVDVTERKTLAQQLMQAQKMEAIGQLASGVAHDFNNILAATMLHLGLLQQNPTLHQETKETLAELERETQRAANLTRQLLTFSRRSILEAKPLDLNEVLANLLKMLKRLIGEHINLQFEPNVDLPLVEADPGMIEQVVLNLSVNSRDAMPRGGKLAIRLDAVNVDQKRARVCPETRPGCFVCLSVAYSDAARTGFRCETGQCSDANRTPFRLNSDRVPADIGQF